MPKSPVSLLVEYATKRHLEQPHYMFVPGNSGGFDCKIILLDMEAFGNGRSKRDAKYLSALNLIKLMNAKCDPTNFEETAEMLRHCDSDVTNVNHDVVKELRDYCVKHEMPLPTIEIIQQSGTPNAPEFLAECIVTSIKRYATSDKKKDARQRVAIKMLSVIREEDDHRDMKKQVATVSSAKDTTPPEAENERRPKFENHHELKQFGNPDNYGVKYIDRHNYFKNFHPELKDAAFKIIASTEYASDKDKALDIVKALRLKMKVSEMESNTDEPLLFIELNSDFDCVFLSTESTIYTIMIRYFNTMLK